MGSSVGDVSRCDLRKGESGAQTSAHIIGVWIREVWLYRLNTKSKVALRLSISLLGWDSIYGEEYVGACKVVHNIAMSAKLNCKLRV